MRGIVLRAGVIGTENGDRVSSSLLFMLNFLNSGLSASQTYRWRTQLGFLHHNASLIFKSFSSVVKLSESNEPKQKQEGDESFTITYLMNSCGLSAKVATQVSKRVKFKDPENPDSVLNLFRSYGFSDTQISKIVKNLPSLLLVKLDKTLLPKLRFFQSIGISCSELPEFLILNSLVLKWSLKNRIIPRYEILKSVLDDDVKVNIALKRSGRNFLRQDVTNMVPNIKVLREYGVPQSSVTQMLTNYPNLVFMNHAKFVEHVKFAKEVGIEPFKAVFIQAIFLSSTIRKSTWESKLDIFERCGWSRDVTLSVFRKYPFCMRLSEEKITSSMKFLVDEMGLLLEDIASFPQFLGHNLKQRIIPRCSVVKILKMKGLINNDKSLSSIIVLSEKKFLQKFVVRFKESVPELLNIYRGELEPLSEVQS